MTLPIEIDDVIGWAWFFLLGWGLLFTLYVTAQVAALARLHGIARILAAVPIPFMLWVLYFTFDALAQKAHLWPIVLIFTSPIALAYVVIVATIAFIVRRVREKRANASTV
jgi:hypothetical protein